MKFSTLFTALPVLALAAPALGTPIAKKRACTRPSASASVSVSAAPSSVADSASASATASPTSSINTGVFAPAPSADGSLSLEPTSSAESSATASASEPTASAEPSSSESMTPSSTSAPPAESSAASGESDADLFVRLHNDFRAQYGELRSLVVPLGVDLTIQTPRPSSGMRSSPSSPGTMPPSVRCSTRMSISDDSKEGSVLMLQFRPLRREPVCAPPCLIFQFARLTP